MSDSETNDMVNFLAFDGDPLEADRLKSAECQMVNLGVAIYRGDRPAPGVCPVCTLTKPDVAVRRLNTMYDEDSSNWLHSCEDCYTDTVDHYRDLWNEYHNGLGV